MKHYTQEEHTVRQTMVKRQRDTINKHQCASAHFIEWRNRLWLDTTTVPQRHETTEKIAKRTDRKLEPAEDPYLSGDQWFDALEQKIFPVTDYIRPMKDIDFTPLPDLFHEYFGHMPAMTLPFIADLEHKTALIYKSLQTEQQKKELFALSRYSIEYGVIKEWDSLKAFGAWLLSSPWDLTHFAKGGFELEPATVAWIIGTTPSPHEQHKKLFVFDNLLDFNTILDDYILTLNRHSALS